MKAILIFGLCSTVFSLAYGVRRFIINRQKNVLCPVRNLVLFALFPLSQCGLIIFLCNSQGHHSVIRIIEFIAAIALCLIGNIQLTEYLFDSASREELERSKVDALSQLSLNEELLKLASEENKNLLQERDAFIAKMNSILENKEVSSAESSGKICENSYVNAVLSQKKEEIESNNIEFSFDIDVPQSIGIDALDLASVFMNVIDNAINACKVYEGERTRIALQAGIQGNMLFINETNSADSNSQVVDRKRKHYGKKIISEYVDKYSGHITSKWIKKEKLYEVKILMQEVAK